MGRGGLESEATGKVRNRDGVSLRFFSLTVTLILLILLWHLSREFPLLSFSVTDFYQVSPSVVNQDYSPHLLEELMYKYGSDKSHDDHGYTDIYQMIFNPIRLQVKNMTEIGVSVGQSLQGWYHYFPNADIYGFDPFPQDPVEQVVASMSDRVFFQAFDLSSSTDLEHDVGLYDESMDVIIDDATHHPLLQQTLLANLFRLVKPGGYYIIEDLYLHEEEAQVWQSRPEELIPEVQKIWQEHDAILVDAHVGHRAWELWLERSSDVAKSHVLHNSYILILHKRWKPRPPVLVNAGVVAMHGDKVVLGGAL